MRTRCALLVAAALVASACGGSSDKAATPSSPSPVGTTAAATASPAQVQTRLLTVADVGAGWKAGQPINGEDLAAFAQLPCEAAMSPAIVKRLTASSGVQFEPADRSYEHLIELVTTGQPTQLAADLASLLPAIDSCATTGNLTVKKLTIPALGEQRAAYAIRQTRPGSPTGVYVRTAYLRVGSAAVMLGLADFQAPAKGAPQTSDAAFLELVQKAAAKLKG